MASTEPPIYIPWSLELFKKTPEDVTIDGMEVVPYRPIATFSPHDGDLTFRYTGDDEDYFYPHMTSMTFDLRITRANGEALRPNEVRDVVGPENNIAHTVFATGSVTLNNQVINHEAHLPHKAHLINLMSYGNDAKESHLTTSLYYKDTAGEMNAFYNTADANAGNRGLNKRAAFFVESNTVQVHMRPALDFFSQPKFILNKVDMTLGLTRTRPEFALHAERRDAIQAAAAVEAADGVVGQPAVLAQPALNPDFRIEVTNPILWIVKAKIFPKVWNGHMAALQGDDAVYNTPRVVVKPFTIPQGLRAYTVENVTTGQLPKRITFGFLTNTAYNGDYVENPFNYRHVNLTQTAVYVNGKSHPLTPYKPVYRQRSTGWMNEYSSLFKAFGIHQGNSGLDINREEYPNGYCLYSFDLTPNFGASDWQAVCIDKDGNVRIELQFSQDLDQAYVCMVYAEYNSKFFIDKDRNVYTNYTV
jgi:hypothetical protein